MMPFRSIRAKSIAYTLLIILVPMLLLGTAGTLYYRGVIMKNVQTGFLEEARTVSALTANYVDRVVLYLERQSESAQLINPLRQHEAAALDAKVQRIDEATTLYYWIFVTDPSGQVLSSHPYGGAVGQNYGDSPVIAEPLRTGKAYLGRPAVNEVTGRQTTLVGTPVVENNATIGVLAGAIDTGPYLETLSQAQAGLPAQDTFLVNDTGHIVGHINKKYMGTVQAFPATSIVQGLSRDEDGVQEYDDPVNGGRWLGAYSPVRGYDYGVIVAAPLDAAYKPVNDATGIFAMALLLMTALASAAALAVGNYLVRPIAGIAQATDLVGRDVDLSKYLPYDREDELGQLARSFKGMSDRITAARGKMLGEMKRADMYIDVMGHDINNYNQVILANLEILPQLDTMNDRQRKFVQCAVEAINDSARIIQSVKAIQAASVEPLKTRAMDLDDLLRGCTKEAPRPEGKTVELDYTPQKGKIIRAVPAIGLAFCNVIRNSVRYSGPRVHIDIQVSETISDGRKYYVIAVADDGFGIPDHVKQHLFTRFQDESKVPPGKGLGLYTAKVLVERSGGSLVVGDRVPGDYRRGTVVTITLPAAEE